MKLFLAADGVQDVPGGEWWQKRHSDKRLGEWLHASVSPLPGGEVDMRDLYRLYREWCVSEGFVPIRAQALGMRIAGRRRQSNGRTFLLGAVLTQELPSPIQ